MGKKEDTKRLNVIDWVIVAGIAAVLMLAVAVAQYRYTITGVQESYDWNASFAVNKTEAVIETQQHWAKGNVNYGVNQTSGTAKTTLYSIYYKKNSNSYILEYASGYTNANNTYYGAWFMHSTSGTDKYAYKLIKETNTSVASAMTVNLMLN